MKPTASQLSDEELILRYYASRDDFAFEELKVRYSSRLYGVFVRRRVPEIDISDLVSDTWLRVIRTIEPGKTRYDPAVARFATYLYSIAVNLVMDKKRGVHNRPEIRESELSTGDDAEVGAFFDRIAGTGPDPEEEFAIEEIRTKLELCLSQLPESLFLIVHFRDDDLTFAEIGEILKMPLQTVVTRHRRALDRLRVCVTTGLATDQQQL